jgi:hypothetical protein
MCNVIVDFAPPEQRGTEEATQPDGFWFSGLREAPIFPQSQAAASAPLFTVFLITSLKLFLT